MVLMESVWTALPPPGELLWEFDRASDGRRLRCEVVAPVPDIWQVLVYVDGQLLAWHSGFSLRASAEQWAARTRMTLARGRGRRTQVATVTTQTPPIPPPALCCQHCSARLEYLRSYVTRTGRTSNQWDRFRCPKGCGEFEFRPRTRRLTRASG